MVTIICREVLGSKGREWQELANARSRSCSPRQPAKAASAIASGFISETNSGRLIPSKHVFRLSRSGDILSSFAVHAFLTGGGGRSAAIDTVAQIALMAIAARPTKIL
jgi:hypothetical protein